MRLRIRTLIIAFALLAPATLLSAGAAEVSDVASASVPDGFVLEDGAVAIPLGLPTPAEYTPEIHEKVLAASAKGLAYDAVNDREVMLATNFLFIRPGAWMWSPSWCTMNFIYRDNNGALHIGSAGHCNSVGTPVVIIVYPGVFANIGTTTVSTGPTSAPGNDYSLTKINASWLPFVDANVADIWGPQGGAYTGTAYVGLVGKHFGHGLGIGTTGTPRAGQVMFVHTAVWGCACAVIFGDSGGPILAVTQANPLGQALGVVTHLTAGTSTALGTRVTVVPAVVKNGDLNPLPPA